MFLIHPSPVLYDIEVKKLTTLRRPKDLCQDAVDFDCDTPDSKEMRADKLWQSMPGLLRTGDVETQRCRDDRDRVSKPGRRSKRVSAAAEIRRWRVRCAMQRN